MIAKGHDYPSVTLVGVINADTGLGLPDFRAAENVFQLAVHHTIDGVQSFRAVQGDGQD